MRPIVMVLALVMRLNGVAVVQSVQTAGFSKGDRVKCLVVEPPLKIGDAGAITDVDAGTGKVVVLFDSYNKKLKLTTKQVCKPRDFGKLTRELDEQLARAGFSKGDRVKSLVGVEHWNPRPLKVGDAGTVVAGSLEQDV